MSDNDIRRARRSNVDNAKPIALNPSVINSRSLRTYGKSHSTAEYRSGWTNFPACGVGREPLSVIKEHHNYFTYHPRRPPSYAEAVSMQKLRAARQRRSTVGLSASAIAVAEECAEMFLSPLESDPKCFDPVYLATLFHSKSKMTNFGSTRTPSLETVPSHDSFGTTKFSDIDASDIQCSADYSPAVSETPATKTTIVLRSNLKDSSFSSTDQRAGDGNFRRRSAVEAQSNNSIYCVTGHTEARLSNDNNASENVEKENYRFSTGIFVTSDPKVTQTSSAITRFSATSQQSEKNNSGAEMLRRRHTNVPMMGDYKCEMSDNNNCVKLTSANLPAKFPVNYQESEMARKRPVKSSSQSTSRSTQPNGSAKLTHQHAKMLNKQQQRSKPNVQQQQQQTPRDRRSRSQPLCQHRQMSASTYGISDDDLIQDLVPATMVPQNCIDYGNFAVDHSVCGFALPSTSSMDFGQISSDIQQNTSAQKQHRGDEVVPRRRRIDLIRDAAVQRHVSRMDRFSIDSEAGMSSQDSGIRSSTHSNSSTVTTHSSSGTNFTDSFLTVEAVWDHVAMMSNELPFRAGDLITVLDASARTPNALWYGVCKDSSGWFPASYVRIKNGDLAMSGSEYLPTFMPHNIASAQNTPENMSSACVSSPSSTSSLADDEDEFPHQMRHLRRRVIEELLNTERDYVRLLQNLVQGFVEQCRRRKELFPDERIARIFGNVEQICTLHVKLLRDLEACIDESSPANSCVGVAFLRNNFAFGVYTEYCNNRPVSCSELALLVQNAQYHHFFEACRLLRGMAKLSLEGFLLTPVQRICRYPLQLFELLKATPQRHRDRQPLEQAHAAMRAVAAHINDAKRRVDAIQKIVLWQKNVHGFRGPDLIDNNHRMLISGEMHCRAIQKNGGTTKNDSSGTGNGSSNSNTTTTSVLQWSKTVHVYLFDQSIILCKKDVLKKNCLVFKERMSLQSTSVQDLHDGKESLTGANLRNSFKLIGPSREYIFTCPDPATKSLWLDALWSRPRPQPPSSAERRLAIITLNYLS